MPPFARILLFAGVPLGLAVTFVTALGSPVSWIDLGLTFLVACVVIGGTLATVARVFVGKVRRSVSTILLFVLSMSLAGLMVGLLTYAAASWFPHGRWLRIVSPPEPVLEFAGPTCYRVGGEATVYARATSGHLYAYVRNANGGGTWVAADAVPAVPSDALCEPESRTLGPTPLKLGRVVATRQIDFQGVDCGGRTHFLLLADRSMWRWGTGGCAIGEVVMLIGYAALVVLVSLLVAGGIVVLGPPVGWARAARSTEQVAA